MDGHGVYSVMVGHRINPINEEAYWGLVDEGNQAGHGVSLPTDERLIPGV